MISSRSQLYTDVVFTFQYLEVLGILQRSVAFLPGSSFFLGEIYISGTTYRYGGGHFKAFSITLPAIAYQPSHGLHLIGCTVQPFGDDWLDDDLRIGRSTFYQADTCEASLQPYQRTSEHRVIARVVSVPLFPGSGRTLLNPPSETWFRALVDDLISQINHAIVC